MTMETNQRDEEDVDSAMFFRIFDEMGGAYYDEEQDAYYG